MHIANGARTGDDRVRYHRGDSSAVWLFNNLTQRVGRFLTDVECQAQDLAVTTLREEVARWCSTAMGDHVLRSEINVTPLVDVILVLLVIFMVVTPLLQQQLPIDLPSTRTSRAANDSSQVRLTAAADGTLRPNDQPISTADLQPALRDLYATRGDRILFLEADRGLSYAAVVDLIDACREAGIERIGISPERSVPPITTGRRAPDPLHRSRGSVGDARNLATRVPRREANQSIGRQELVLRRGCLPMPCVASRGSPAARARRRRSTRTGAEVGTPLARLSRYLDRTLLCTICLASRPGAASAPQPGE